jgi:hypothetical protein
VKAVGQCEEDRGAVRLLYNGWVQNDSGAVLQ